MRLIKDSVLKFFKKISGIQTFRKLISQYCFKKSLCSIFKSSSVHSLASSRPFSFLYTSKNIIYSFPSFYKITMYLKYRLGRDRTVQLSFRIIYMLYFFFYVFSFNRCPSFTRRHYPSPFSSSSFSFYPSSTEIKGKH